MIAHTQQLLTDAVGAVDRFEQLYRHRLTTAVNEALDVRRRIENVTADARRVDESLCAADPIHLRYVSVSAAVDKFDRARRALAVDVENGRLASARRGAGDLAEAATALCKALEDAPGHTLRAQQSISTGRTRTEALAHRMDGIRPNLSALLREFPAASSADLMGIEALAAVEIVDAGRLLDHAAAAGGDRPEEALDLAKEARRRLSEAEQLIDSVAQRLDLLRRLREDPGEAERRVRFELRDAQRLALYLDAVEEWASVLDAQLSRIDRIVAALNAPRPDLWAYSRALDQVSQFIADTVAKIRTSARNDR